MNHRTIIFAAGGTGGHVIPAYVLANAIREKHPEIKCIFVGAKGKFEENWIPAQGFEIELLDMGGVSSGSLGKRLKSLWQLPGAFWRSWSILKKYKPERLFGVGGYASAPIMFLASLKNIPCAIIEPNAVAGRSNRMASIVCKRVYTVFESARRYFPEEKIKHFGHLLRKSVLDLEPPDFSQKNKTISVLCGSQGSQKINQVFCDMVGARPSYFSNFNIYHQAGVKNQAHVALIYKNLNINAQVFGFSDDMERIYKQTHIIIGRSGSSVIEFASVGIPSILIPLAIAADDHQKKNALSVVETGGAVMIEEKNLDPDQLFTMIKDMLDKDLQAMSQRLQVLKKSNALDDIMDDFLAL